MIKPRYIETIIKMTVMYMRLAKKVSIASLCFLLLSNGAHAAEWYLGIDSFNWELEDNSLSEKVNDANLRARMGIVVSENIVIETQAAFPGRVNKGATSVDFLSMFNFLAKGSYPVDKATVYGIIGVTSVRTIREFDLYRATVRDSGLSYGLGADYRLSKQLAINADYIQYLNNSDIKIKAYTLGLSYYF